MRTLILGLGDQGLHGNRVGLEVARKLHAMLGDPDVDIIEATTSGLDLIEVAAGYDKVVVVDSIRTGEGDVGELRRLGLSDLELVPHAGSGGDAEYRARLELAAPRGTMMPREMSIYAIEVGENVQRSGEVAEIAREAVPRLVAQIAREEFGTVTLESEWF
jgi:hydrogenase maturation protease